MTDVRELTTERHALAPAPFEAGRGTLAPNKPLFVSHEQMRLAFVQNLYPERATYHIALGLRIDGAVDPDLLERALSLIVARHEPLRTRFDTANEGYTASSVDAVAFTLARLDLRQEDAADTEHSLADALSELVLAPFDLTRAPLLRARLLRVADESHLLALVAHQIVFDLASGEILLRELLAHYDALATYSTPATLPALAANCDEVLSALAQRFDAEEREQALAYWKQQLGGSLPVLQLPHDHPRPRVFSYRGRLEALHIPAPLAEHLRARGAQGGGELASLLLAAFFALLHRYSGQSDILVGVPALARERPEAAPLIGLLVDMLVVRGAFTPKLTFAEHLDNVRARYAEALAQRALPFEELVSALNPPRDPALTPIFQSFFAYHTRARAAPSEHLKTSRVLVDPGFARTDLGLIVEDLPGAGIDVYFEYCSDLFDASTIAQLAHGYLSLLAQVAEAPETELDRLPVMSSEERARQLIHWNQTGAAFDLSQSVVHLFEQTAHRQPERTALYWERTSLSYANLLSQVRELSASLAAAGAGKGRGVAVFLERGPRLLVGLLAIMRTGAHYIPLDPSHPAERNRRILNVAAPSLVLLEEATRAALPGGSAAPLFDLDAAHADEAPDPGVRCEPDAIAYIIFTSGSTGDPKGVEVPQRALSNFLYSMAQAPGMGPDDTLLALTTISFDIAGLELYLPLVTGGSVEIAGREVALDPALLADRLRARPVTIFQATPATFRMLLEDGWEGQPALKILCGGEAFPPDLARTLVARVGSVWNMYGPTETTVWSSLQRLSADDRVISIGHPIHNTQLYVLNEALEPMPRGAAGMLYIGGDGVALGYHKRPDLSAAAFQPNPFVTDLAARIYRTGDLARRLADGRLECLGRTDFQVKIRGYRIELGEIEAALIAHPSVIQAVVHVKPDPGGDKQLVGYVVLDDRGSELPGNLLDHVKGKLPSYMVPSALLALPAFPLTPNGKVDRKALPDPEPDPRARSSMMGMARDDIEVKISIIFAKLLGRTMVGIDDNFFELGGHSLLAVRVTRELNRAFGLELSVGALFENPTVAGLAALVRKGGGSLGSAVLPLREGSGLPPLYFVCGIQLYQTLARRLGDRQPSFGIFVPTEEEFLTRYESEDAITIEDLASSYREAIRNHCPRGPYSLAGVSFGGLLAFEVARQLRAAGDEVALLVLLDALRPNGLRRNGVKWLAKKWSSLQQQGVRGLYERVRNRLESKPPPAEQEEQRRDELLWRVFNGEVTDRYFAGRPRYDGPTLIVRAADRPELAGYDVAPDLGWSAELTGPFKIAEVAGDHLGILREKETAHVMRAQLEAAFRNVARLSYRPSQLPTLDDFG
jgi:amino acid adenylation domain-containing protein